MQNAALLARITQMRFPEVRRFVRVDLAAALLKESQWTVPAQQQFSAVPDHMILVVADVIAFFLLHSLFFLLAAVAVRSCS